MKTGAVALLVTVGTLVAVAAAVQARNTAIAPAYRVNLPTGQNVPARNPRRLVGQMSASGERLYEIEVLLPVPGGPGAWTKTRIGDTQVTHGVLP